MYEMLTGLRPHLPRVNDRVLPHKNISPQLVKVVVTLECEMTGHDMTPRGFRHSTPETERSSLRLG